jgi:hypothetical protein
MDDETYFQAAIEALKSFHAPIGRPSSPCFSFKWVEALERRIKSAHSSSSFYIDFYAAVLFRQETRYTIHGERRKTFWVNDPVRPWLRGWRKRERKKGKRKHIVRKLLLADMWVVERLTQSSTSWPPRQNGGHYTTNAHKVESWIYTFSLIFFKFEKKCCDCFGWQQIHRLVELLHSNQPSIFAQQLLSCWLLDNQPSFSFNTTRRQ